MSKGLGKNERKILEFLEEKDRWYYVFEIIPLIYFGKDFYHIKSKMTINDTLEYINQSIPRELSKSEKQSIWQSIRRLERKRYIISSWVPIARSTYTGGYSRLKIIKRIK